MPHTCPWCDVELDRDTVRALGKIPEPCPHCNSPIKEPVQQVLLVVGLLLPLIGVTLYLAKQVYDQGHTNSSLFVLMIGAVAGFYLQRMVPVLFNPARGFGQRRS